MSYQKDFLTNVADALLKLFNANAMLKQYNWDSWDSDKPVRMPRGYLNVQADQSLIDTGTPWTVKPEVVLEGKPKRAKLSAVMNELEKILEGDALHVNLNTNATGLVLFFHRAENMSVRQSIEQGLRVRRITFSIEALNVANQ